MFGISRRWLIGEQRSNKKCEFFCHPISFPPKNRWQLGWLRHSRSKRWWRPSRDMKALWRPWPFLGMATTWLRGSWADIFSAGNGFSWWAKYPSVSQTFGVNPFLWAVQNMTQTPTKIQQETFLWWHKKSSPFSLEHHFYCRGHLSFWTSKVSPFTPRAVAKVQGWHSVPVAASNQKSQVLPLNLPVFAEKTHFLEVEHRNDCSFLWSGSISFTNKNDIPF